MFRYFAEDIAFLLIKNRIVDIEKREECVRTCQKALWAVFSAIIVTALVILLCDI